MSVVDQQHVAPSSSSSTKFDPSSPALSPSPSILTLDFASNPILRQVTTLLRRVWLLDPPLSDEELADVKTVQQCLQSVTQIVSEEFSSSSSSTTKADAVVAEEAGAGEEKDNEENGGGTKKWDDDDDEAWKKRTQFRLLSDPVVLSVDREEDHEGEGEGEDGHKWLKSVVSPWREEIYDVYRHVFADFWRMAVKQSSSSFTGTTANTDTHLDLDLGVFEPTRGNAVSVAALPSTTTTVAATTTTTTTTSSRFQTDTFLYPVWVNPKAKIAFSVGEDGEEKHCWMVGEARTWTTGLWVRAGQTIAVRTEMREAGAGDAGAGADRTGLAAVFVTGHCDERKRKE